MFMPSLCPAFRSHDINMYVATYFSVDINQYIGLILLITELHQKDI
jgi:hypothetical protein